MRIPFVVSAIVLVACSGTGGSTDSTGVDSTVVSAPAVHDSTARPDTGNIPAGDELELRTDKTTYRAGDQVGLTVVNPTGSSYAYNPCTRWLERDVSGEWVKLEEMRVCTMIAHILAPRTSRSEKTDITAGIVAGRYRLSIAFSVQDSSTPSRSVRVMAPPITVTR